MGVSGLHSVIKPICSTAHLSHFRGQRAAVDASSWLHKGAISCARELVREIPTRKYVDYCLFRVRMLLHHGVAPTLVFDGAPLPLKAAENTRRSAMRKEACAKALELERNGDMKAALEMYQRGVSVTHEMAREIIKEIRKIDAVEYIVAPYEADAQMAWLSVNDKVDVVVTEDSDLIVYGAKRIFYKLNKEGCGELYETSKLLLLENPDMRNFTPAMFTWVCVLSGCDFFDGVKGLGIRKAHEVVRRSRTLDRTLYRIRYDTKYHTVANFADGFYRACMVFRHQTVYDVDARTSTHLTPLDDEARAGIPERILQPVDGQPEPLDFIGRLHDGPTAVAVASGVAHPTTLVPYQDSLDQPTQAPLPSRKRAPLATSASPISSFLSRTSDPSPHHPPKKQSGGMQVSLAPRSGQPRRELSRPPSAKTGPTRISRFFERPSSGSQANSPAPSVASPAVTEAFKPPNRSQGTCASTDVPSQTQTPGDLPLGKSEAVTTDPSSAWQSQAKKEWHMRSLRSRYPASKREKASSPLRPSKRQRTLFDVGNPKPLSSRNRFANPHLPGIKVIGGSFNSRRLVGEQQKSTPHNPTTAGGSPRRGTDGDENFVDELEIPDVPSSPERDMSPITPALDGTTSRVQKCPTSASAERVELAASGSGTAVLRRKLNRQGPSAAMMAQVSAVIAASPSASPSQHASEAGYTNVG